MRQSQVYLSYAERRCFDGSIIFVDGVIDERVQLKVSITSWESDIIIYLRK